MKAKALADCRSVDRQVICALLDAGSVDSDLLVRMAQLMALPGLHDLFRALGDIDPDDTVGAAAVLEACAARLAGDMASGTGAGANLPGAAAG